MARSKVKMNFSYDKLSRKLAQNITTGINQLGKRINIKIGENLENGVDLSGTKSHKPLSPDSTIPIRNRRGQGNKPLVISGKLEERKISQATISNPVFEIDPYVFLLFHSWLAQILLVCKCSLNSFSLFSFCILYK